jgi:hypothetical protein
MVPDDVTRTGRIVVCVLATWGAACATPAPRTPARAAPSPATPGPPARYAYHFNRNALAASVRTKTGGLLALTDTGNLLLFDDETLALRGERVPRSAVTCLGPVSAAGVVVGLEDGRLVEVEIPSLAMKRVGEVDGRPSWIGRAPSGALLVAHGLMPEKPLGWRGRGPESLVLEELGTGRMLRLPFVGHAFLVAGDGRLWVGADEGELGGHLAVVDLRGWSLREIDDSGASPRDAPQGIQGFIETAAGRVWAYGGTMHVGGRASFIMAVDQEPIAKLFDLPYTGRATKTDRPSLPVTNVVPVSDGSFLVFAHDQVFETDARLASWRRLPELGARYKPGRPDADGASPVVKSVHLLGRSPRRLAIATAVDGWVELRGETLVPHRLSGQLGKIQVGRFDDWAGRLVARGETLDAGAWVLGGDGEWRAIEATCPVALPETTANGWTPDTIFLRRPDGKLLAAFRDQPAHWRTGKPALLVTTLCSEGRCDVLGSEQSLLHPKDMFLVPDGGAWALDELGLWRFIDGRWALGVARGKPGEPSPLAEPDHIAAVVPTGEPPWVLHAQTELAVLSPGTPTSAPRMTVPAGQPPAGPFQWVDVTACAGRVYVARKDGVCALDVATGTCAPIPLDKDVVVNHLGCDREGRLWLGGRALWSHDGATATEVHDLDALTAGKEIGALGRDTGGGLPVAIEDRGVAVLFPPKPVAEAARADADEGDRVLSRRRRQAVFLVFQEPRTGRKQDPVAALDEALLAAKAGRFAGHVEHPTLGARPVFYGPDAAKMVEIMRDALARLGRKATLFERDGEAGVPERKIEVGRGGKGQ